jgi:hypothetical protein
MAMEKTVPATPAVDEATVPSRVRALCQAAVIEQSAVEQPGRKGSTRSTYASAKRNSRERHDTWHDPKKVSLDT